jgi:hypothetical protein
MKRGAFLQDAAQGLAMASALLCGCSSSTAPSVSLPSFDDVEAAPATIQMAAHAVVLVSLPYESATASYISPNGLLLTNNHVLGVGACPVEGCYAELTEDFQRGAPPQKPRTVFLVPLAIDIGLDMAILQASQSPGGPALSTPNYLTIDARTPAELEGTHVNVVGHPEASLKKWTSGEVVGSNGEWVWTTSFTLPGNSGSPVLDDHGHLVALLHRGAEGLDLVAGNGLDAFSVATASSALIAAIGKPLPPTTWSVLGATSETNALNDQFVYLTSRTQSVNVGAGASMPMIDILGTACDAALAMADYVSPEALSAALQPCVEAEFWIECRADAMTTFSVCPPDRDAWRRRQQARFDYWRTFNGELELDAVSFAQGELADSMADGVTAGSQLLTQALGEAQPALDFHVAAYLAAFQIYSYRGASVLAFVRDYKNVADYGLNGGDLVSAVLWLAHDGVLAVSDAKSMLDDLHDDPSIDLAIKLFIELYEYRYGILP